jgi:hypothetical protein
MFFGNCLIKVNEKLLGALKSIRTGKGKAVANEKRCVVKHSATDLANARGLNRWKTDCARSVFRK